MSSQRKVVVVTEASRGIGETLVKAYRERDYRVVAVARSAKPSSDPEIVAVAGDIADAGTARRAIDEAVARFGASTRWSTTPASSSPSRSPSTPRPTIRRSWA